MPAKKTYEFRPRTYKYFRPFYSPYGYTSNVQVCTSLTLKDSPRKGDHRTPLPYQNGRYVLNYAVSNSGELGWSSTTGSLNITSFGALDNVRYLTGGSMQSPLELVQYPMNMTNGLASQALANIADLNMSLAGLADLVGTASTLGNRAQDLARVCWDIKHLDFKSLARRFKVNDFTAGTIQDRVLRATNRSSALWLEYRYAVRPLYYDTVDLATTLDEGLGKVLNPVILARSKIKETLTDSKRSSHYKISWDGTAVHRMGLRLRVNNLEAVTLAAMDLSTPTLVWEAIPFSFIVDWVIDIGTWLRAIQMLPHVTFLDGYQSVKITAAVVQKSDLVATSEGQRYNYDEFAMSAECYRRWIFRSMPMPLPHVENPFSGLDSVGRTLDLFALSFRKAHKSLDNTI